MAVPEVTILMPVYNAAPYLNEAIDSMLNQSYADFEFLIINDGSTDESENIILSYNDSRIRYIKNESNIKLIATLNKGIKEAKGKYIVRMDADDISLPSRIEKQVSYMDAHPLTAICGSWFESFGIKNVLTQYEEKHADIMYRMLYQCHLCHPSLILRKDQIESFDTLFDPDFAHAEDYDFFVRVGQRYKLANLQEVLIKYRTHTDSVSAKNKDTQNENSTLVKKREFERIGYPLNAAMISDFTLLNYYYYNDVKSSSSDIRSALENIISANKKSKVFNQEFLEKKLSELWFHYCYQAKTAKEFNSSKVLSQYIRPTFIQNLKWLLRK